MILSIAGLSPCVVIQPFEFVQKHVFVIYGLALAWVIVVAVVSALSRQRKAKPIFRPNFARALFSDQWCSGRSFKSLLSRFGGAKHCLWVAVADGELWVGLHFPFNLALQQNQKFREAHPEQVPVKLRWARCLGGRALAAYRLATRPGVAGAEREQQLKQAREDVAHADQIVAALPAQRPGLVVSRSLALIAEARKALAEAR